MYAGMVLVGDGWPGIRGASENESTSGCIRRLASSGYIMTLELCCVVTTVGLMDPDIDVERGNEGDASVEESAWDNGISGWEECGGTGEGERERDREDGKLVPIICTKR